MVSLMAQGSLSRETAHDDFIGLQGRPHLGHTVKSLIDRGFARIERHSTSGYPLKVVKTGKLISFFNQNKLQE